MAETRPRFDQDIRDGAVRTVRETGKPIHDGTLGNWVAKDRAQRGEDTAG
jgi:transposase